MAKAKPKEGGADGAKKRSSKKDLKRQAKAGVTTVKLSKKIRDVEGGITKAKKKSKSTKGKFWAVKVGRIPGVYATAERYNAQIRGYSGAIAKRFATREEAEAFVHGDKSDVQDAVAAVLRDAGLEASTVKYDRSAMPRGFMLGTVRAAGRTTLKESAAPVFDLKPKINADDELPHHRLLRLGQRQPPGRTTGGDADGADTAEAAESYSDSQGRAQPQPSTAAGCSTSSSQPGSSEEGLDSDVMVVGAPGSAMKRKRSNGDDDASSAESSGSDGEGKDGGTSSIGGLDDDFISLGGAAGSGDEGAADSTVAEGEEETKRTWQAWEHPWHDANQQIASQSLRLHNEIVELTTLLRPTAEEDKQRHEAFALVEGVVESVFPGAELRIFGSFSTGLHLPTSDVDCVILNAGVGDLQVPKALHGLGAALAKQGWVSNLEVITGAKVPIVKLTVMPFGLKFDISMGKINGLSAVDAVKKYLSTWPALRPLVTILKLFLLQRNMNEVFSGGLGSFALLISVVSFLQLHQSRVDPLIKEQRVGELEGNLGLLLVDYFRFYGRALNYYEIGVTCADGGRCYSKRATVGRADHRDRGDRFSLLDPLDPSNDASRGSFNSRAVRSAFDHAYNMLTIPSPDRSTSQLARILRLDEVLAIRPPPPKARPPTRRSGHSQKRYKWSGPQRYNDRPPQIQQRQR